MEKDVFYVVTIPAYTRNVIDSLGCKGYMVDDGWFFEKLRYVPPTPTTYKTVVVPEEKYYFEKRKKAKKFCLENNYPLTYITEEMC